MQTMTTKTMLETMLTTTRLTLGTTTMLMTLCLTPGVATMYMMKQMQFRRLSEGLALTLPLLLYLLLHRQTIHPPRLLLRRLRRVVRCLLHYQQRYRNRNLRCRCVVLI